MPGENVQKQGNKESISDENRVSFLLENLTPEDTVIFSKELDGLFKQINSGEIENIPESFWDKWYRKAEFETDKNRIRKLQDSAKVIELTKDRELSWEETLFKQAGSEIDFQGPWFTNKT
jgi:hypothetical protein